MYSIIQNKKIDIYTLMAAGADGEWGWEKYLKKNSNREKRRDKERENTIYLNVINMSIYWI